MATVTAIIDGTGSFGESQLFCALHFCKWIQQQNQLNSTKSSNAKKAWKDTTLWNEILSNIAQQIAQYCKALQSLQKWIHTSEEPLIW